MTPKKKTSNSTTLKMERKRIIQAKGDAKVHVAGGSNAGIIVNKQQDTEDELADVNAHLCLEFRVFLVNTSTKKYTQEKRVISFWFKELFPVHQRTNAAQEFFKKLVSPVDFPRGVTTCVYLCISKLTFLPFRLRWFYKENYEAHAAPVSHVGQS